MVTKQTSSMALHSWIWLVNFLVLATQLPLFSQSTDATEAVVLAGDKFRRTRPDTKFECLIRARLTSTEKHHNGGVQMQGEGSCTAHVPLLLCCGEKQLPLLPVNYYCRLMTTLFS